MIKLIYKSRQGGEEMDNVEKIYGRIVVVEGGSENAQRMAERMLDDRRNENDFRWKIVFESVAGGYILREKRHLGGYKWS